MHSILQGWFLDLVIRCARVLYPSGVVSLTEILRGPRGILVMPAESLADTLHALPVVRALRRAFPETRLSVMARPQSSELFKDDTDLNEVILCYPLEPPSNWKAFRQTVSELRSRNFDALFSLDHEHDLVKSLVGYLSGARVRVGFQNGNDRGLYNVMVHAPERESYLPARNLSLLRSVGIDTSGVETTWSPTERERRIARQLADLRGLGREGLLVGFEAETDLRHDPPALARYGRVLRERFDAQFIVVQEAPPAAYSQEADLADVGSGVDMACRTIRDVLAILSCCDLFLCRNTDFLHFAAAMEIPTVAFLPPKMAAALEPPASARLAVVRDERSPEEALSEKVARLVAGRRPKGKAGEVQR